MLRRWFILGAVLGWAVSVPVWGQQGLPDSAEKTARQDKAAQYLRIENERCRSDVAEIWAKGDAAEKRVKELEEQVQQLTRELNLVRGAGGEKPSN